MGIAAAGETASLTGEFVGDTHRGLECTQAHPLRNQYQKDPIWLWVAEGVNESSQRVEQTPLLPIGPSPTYSLRMQRPGLSQPGEHLWLRPLVLNRYTETKKKKRPNKRTVQSSRKSTTKWQRDSWPIRYTVQNTGYQDAPETHRVLQQHKKDPGSNEGPLFKIKKNTGNQQWQEGNQDSNQWFEAEGRRKHSTKTE